MIYYPLLLSEYLPFYCSNYSLIKNSLFFKYLFKPLCQIRYFLL
ncbi:hypothetical protein BBUCA112A_KI0051 (plasmid) [Borreliella burgdorferi CA-11.2A]|nr:hypothetical protein BBUCA112A_KI0051 [Borreliella burgdorferi CA-11.2A]ACN92076.1 hypothetical protein BBU94A_I11 [Borreliella burgdorferi 94a]